MRFCLRMWYACECDCKIWEGRPGRYQRFVFVCLSLLVQIYTETTKNFSRDRGSLNQTFDLQNAKQWAWFSTDCIFDIPRVFLIGFLIGSMRYTTSSIARRRTGQPRWIRVSKASPAVTVVKVHTFRYTSIIIFEFWRISLSKLPISSCGSLYVSCLF
jgi:hypothetical protein